MTDLESPEALAERLMHITRDGYLTIDGERGKLAALIRADREAVRAEALRPFEELAERYAGYAEYNRAEHRRLVDNRVLAGIYRQSADEREGFVKDLRALLPPHQPPKSEPGDGEAGGQR